MIVDYTLPKEQFGGRGFAVQLYHEDVKKKKTTETFFGSYAESKLAGTTLHFELDAPALQVKKDEMWLLVLYGDELPRQALRRDVSKWLTKRVTQWPTEGPGSPSASPSASASPSPAASPTSSP